jgi:hypothetical protein
MQQTIVITQKTMAIDEVYQDQNEKIDVYSILGIRFRSGVVRKEATTGLLAGFYIVGNEKIVIK